jgi:selenocysteine lyase/cysteine desulfurase
VNLDYAASTPPLDRVADAVNEFLPWYSSVHRGSGFKSRVATAAFEAAREAVARFVGARDDDVVVFVGNTTEAINILGAALPRGTRVLGSPAEHHANMLPWRELDLELLPFTSSPGEFLDACERALAAARGHVRLVAVTGASNVTGEVTPVEELAGLAHRHGAELFVDAAQLAPHRPISLRTSGIDYVAVSGHKLYAPFGVGALVGRRDGLRDGVPLVRGGGAVSLVTLDDVVWPGLRLGSRPALRTSSAPWRSPSPVRSSALPWPRSPSPSRLSPSGSGTGSSASPGFDCYASGPTAPATASAWRPSPSTGYPTTCSPRCSPQSTAQPLIRRLLGVTEVEARQLAREIRRGDRRRLPGAVRASIGLGTEAWEIEALAEALIETATNGPGWQYAYDPCRDEFVPDPDPRVWPDFPWLLRGAPSAARSEGARSSNRIARC